MLLALRDGSRAEGTSVLWGAALAFAAHCRVEGGVSPRNDVSGTTLMTIGGVRGENQMVVYKEDEERESPL